jgi:hypothetical protein
LGELFENLDPNGVGKDFEELDPFLDRYHAAFSLKYSGLENH